jgi:IS4 transposase
MEGVMSVEFLKSKMFQRFATERPVAVMTQMTLSHLLDAKSLDRLFADNAEHQYERALLFSTLTELVSSVVLGKDATVNAACRRMKDRLGVSVNATYGKLQRVEPGLSQALVRYSYEQTVKLHATLGGTPRHDIAGYDTRILDGNHLSGTEHRLKETRDTTAAPLPGKSLVVMSPRHDAICDYFPIEDGHAQERSALDDVLETVQRNQLWVADRNFCTLKFMYGIFARSGVFIIRQHGNLVGDGSGRLKKIRATETGTVYEQELHLPAYDGESLTVRRIVVKLNKPTRDGDAEIAILTNIPEVRADAPKIAEIYRLRWRIETAFQHLTKALTCEINSLCYPKAALFCFASALVAYNALAIVKAAIGSAHGQDAVSSLSHYYMALEISETTDGMLIALPPDDWQCFVDMASADFASSLIAVAAPMNPRNYRKSVRGPKKTKPKKKHRKQAVHLSTKQILEKRAHAPC